MGSQLARIGDVQTLIRTRKEALIGFLTETGATVQRLATTFEEDLNRLEEPARTIGHRLLDTATTIVGNVNDELAQLNDPAAPPGAPWIQERIANARTIVEATQELSDDMIGFLQTGEIPSDKRRRKQMWIFGGMAAAIGGLGYFLWWKNEKEAEAEQTRMIESGELEDCGCDAPA